MQVEGRGAGRKEDDQEKWEGKEPNRKQTNKGSCQRERERERGRWERRELGKMNCERKNKREKTRNTGWYEAETSELVRQGGKKKRTGREMEKASIGKERRRKAGREDGRKGK